MIISTKKEYKTSNILGLMSDLVASRLSDGYKIDFEQQLYIRDCSHIEDVIGETYTVQTNHLESVLTYIVCDFADQDICIMECHFEPEAIDDVSFLGAEKMVVACFKPNFDGTYSLKGIRLGL